MSLPESHQVVFPCDLPWKSPQPWGPAPAGTTIDRCWRFRPRYHEGYTAILKRISLRAKNATTNLYDQAVAPEWWVGFLDPTEDLSPPSNTIGTALPAALIQPIASAPEFFELAGVFALVTLTNAGLGFDFPLTTPTIYAPGFVYARTIGDNAQVGISPLIQYVRNDVRAAQIEAAMKGGWRVF
jgi:hypothetical protein